MIVACGTSYHAGLIGRYAIEEFSRVPVEVEIASEYRYRNPIVGPGAPQPVILATLKKGSVHLCGESPLETTIESATRDLVGTGFDDVALSSLAVPSLTTVRQPMEAMGGLAVNIVMEGINAALEKREWNVVNQKVNPELVIRDSTKAAVHGSSD